LCTEYVFIRLESASPEVGLSESQTNTTDDEKLGKDSVTASSLSLLQRYGCWCFQTFIM